MPKRKNITDLDLCQMVAYYIKTNDYICILTIESLYIYDDWGSILIQPKSMGVCTNACNGNHLVVPDMIVISCEPISPFISPFNFFTMHFLSRITTVVFNEPRLIESAAPKWKIKEEFLFRKVLITKNKKNYKQKAPIQEDRVIGTEFKYVKPNLYECAVLAEAKLAGDVDYYRYKAYKYAREEFERRNQKCQYYRRGDGSVHPDRPMRPSQHHVSKRRGKKCESLFILQKLRKFGSSFIRIHR